MLDAEEAKAALASLARDTWHAEAVRRVGRLKRTLRGPARTLIERQPERHTQETRERRREELWAAATELDQLGDRHLRQLMEALHPSLGATLAHWWVAAQAQPYGQGWARRAFRAPSTPSITRERRVGDLEAMVHGAGPYDRPPEWFAAWGPYLQRTLTGRYRALDLGPVLAAAIDGGGPSGQATFRTLIDSANGDHPVGGMGRHVLVGLLRSSREDGWAHVEAMLLAAQRQEGLRQSILEVADEGRPEAFTRIIDLVVREDLLRFAATVRAVSVWFGFPEDAEHLDDARQRLHMLQAFRAERARTEARVLEGDAWETYAGLCALAQFDVVPTLDLARVALRLEAPDNRAAALRFITNAQLPTETTTPIFTAVMADPDPAVASLAQRGLRASYYRTIPADLYQPLDQLARRLPEKATTAPPVGIDREPVALDRNVVVSMMILAVGSRPMEPLLEFLPSMDPMVRSQLVTTAAQRGRLDGDLRAAVVKMVGDRSNWVRERAVEAMRNLEPDPAEVPELEKLLTRKAGDLRQGVIGLLSRLSADDAIASVHRLWAGAASQRDAACELLGGMERTDAVVDLARTFLGESPSPTQSGHLEAITSATASTADDPALGLFTTAELTPPCVPGRGSHDRRFTDPAALRIAEALDDLAETHRDTAFDVVTWQGTREVLLADARWLPSPFGPGPTNPDHDAGGMVLPEVFHAWWDGRPADCRGVSDAFDALRALVAIDLCADGGTPAPHLPPTEGITALLRPLVDQGRLQLRHPQVVRHVLRWLLAATADEPAVVECIDGTEAALALIPDGWVEELGTLDDDRRARTRDWRGPFAQVCPWMGLATALFRRDPRLLASDHLARWYGLMRWFGRPHPDGPRYPIDAEVLYAAHAIGAASDADVYQQLVGRNAPAYRTGSDLLRFTRRRRGQIEDRYPTVVPLVDQVRDRVVEIERTRGDLDTAASHLTFHLASVEGADVALELLARLGRATLVQGYTWRNGGRETVYSRLLQISYPAAGDTPERVAELVDNCRLNERRLIDLAMFAPQWAPLIEQVIGWDGLEDAIWWFHTHTKDDRWSVEAEVRETWAAMSAERTPLVSEDLTDGAVDVDWFHRAHRRLGADRWATLHKAAKLASGGSGHRRAQLFAEAMRGELDESALTQRMVAKRHQDSVRALGLLPLPAGSADETALARYQLLREFERGSKKFGQQRQRSEANAVRIAIENLARTSGSPDPQRFSWAMEAAEAGDLADGPVSVVEGDLTITLSVDEEGTADLAVQRGDRALKAVPAKMRKEPRIKALSERRTALKRQAGRVRSSLEQAMVRGDRFVDGDFAALQRHPVVAPMLDLVIWIDGVGATFRRADGLWVAPSGQKGAPTGALRLAHPTDLLGSGTWIDWQRHFFDDARRQPFKQAFRELYVLTEAEAADSPLSRRWSGHQLQSRQAAGLFTARGWLGDFESGQVARTFHHAGLVAGVDFVDGWGTPAEVELPTMDTVCFTRRGDRLAQPLDAVPPVVFSEVMRDLDLVVSVAHAGGVDPETSASTVEMRAALVRETARLMNLDNVHQASSHVVIAGSLGEYSVHLGSGTVHRRPGGALCIIPVDAQRRGRLFLPFADDDPKTAEVVSKVVMLARDSTIKDPTILDQLR